MKQILIEIDEDMAGRLEQVAPARSRRRSEFIRAAIGKALAEAEEERTAEAYRQHPDAGNEAYVDPRVWESKARYQKKSKRG